MYRRDLITNFKRTSSRFVVEDYDTLTLLLKPIEKIITTPNILTEVSNLSNNEILGPGYFDKFAHNISLLTEVYLRSEDIVKVEGFRKFQLTDTGILETAREKYLVLTEDFALSQFLQKQGVDTLNFNHIRTFNWH
jgi:hypothetical protein